MDDHMYDQMLEYAERELIPRFQNEYRECKQISKCPSYKEIQDLCKALNAVAPYAGYERKTPKSFVEWMD